MQALNYEEVQLVSGGGASKTTVAADTTIGAAQIEGYLMAARYGATLGAPAGAVGMLLGGMVGAAVCYYWNSKHPSE